MYDLTIWYLGGGENSLRQDEEETLRRTQIPNSKTEHISCVPYASQK